MPIALPPVPHITVDWGIVAIFGVVYLGMFPGGLPSRLKLDRSGVALLGALRVIFLFTSWPREVAASASPNIPTSVVS